MPFYTFTKQGKAECIVFNGTTGVYEEKNISVTPGDVYEVSLTSFDKLQKKAMGGTREKDGFDEREKLRKADERQQEREKIRAEKLEARLAALEGTADGE